MKANKKTISLSVLMLLMVLGMFSGCTVVEKLDSLNGILEEPAPDPEIAQIVEAEAAFFAEDYQKAKEILAAISENSPKSVYQKYALYGLGCIQIIFAANLDEYKAAITQLQQWKTPGPEIKGFIENPDMLIKALNKKLDLFVECEPEIRYVTSKKEGAVVKKQQHEIKELKENIKKLQHQISVLEAIDQELQEKRKPQ